MASNTTRIEKRWPRWTGTPADIVRLARLAEELLVAAHATESPSATVTVKRENGESSYESADEAEKHLSELDVEAVETVHLSAGTSWKDVHVIINFFKTGALPSGRGSR